MFLPVLVTDLRWHFFVSDCLLLRVQCSDFQKKKKKKKRTYRLTQVPGENKHMQVCASRTLPGVILFAGIQS